MNKKKNMKFRNMYYNSFKKFRKTFNIRVKIPIKLYTPLYVYLLFAWSKIINNTFQREKKIKMKTLV